MKTLFLTVSIFALVVVQALANSIGLAESVGAYKIQRQNQVLPSGPNTAATISPGDRIISDENQVRVQLTSGDSVLLGKRSSAVLTAADKLELEEGEIAFSYSPNSPMALSYKELNFLPLTAGVQDPKKPQLALKTIGAHELYATGLNQPFAIIESGKEPVQVAVLGDSDVMRFLRGNSGQWSPFKMQTPSTSSGGEAGGGAGAGEDKKKCFCDSPISLSDMSKGLSGAQSGKGMIKCRKEKGAEEVAPPAVTIPGQVSLDLPTVTAKCGSEELIPITVHNAANIESFEMVFHYDEWCVEYVSVETGRTTTKWKIEGKDEKKGKIRITGDKDKEGLPVAGDGELLRVRMRCIKNCPCQTELTPTNLQEGLAGAQAIVGYAACRASFSGERPTSPTPTTFAVVAGNDETICGGQLNIPITVYQATNLQSFKMTLLFNEQCLTYLKTSSGADTNNWEIKSDKNNGMIDITGNLNQGGQALNGTAQIAKVRFQCTPAAIIWWPWAGVGAGVGAGIVAIIISDPDDDHNHDPKGRPPQSPILPETKSK